MKKYYSDQYTDFTNSMSDTASVWVTKLMAGRITRTDKELVDWLSENPAHKATFDRMNAIWDEFGEFQDHPLVVNEMNKIKPGLRESRIQKFFGGIFSGSPFMRPLAAAATILVVVAITWMIQYKGYQHVKEQSIVVYQSKIGEQKIVRLEDGSTAILDTNTKLSIRYSDTFRKAKLMAGSAMFSVIHDSNRPFIVFAKNTQVKVLGTEFNVSMQNGHKVVVEVLQGRVHVSQLVVSDMQEMLEEIKKDKPVKRHKVAKAPAIEKNKSVLAKIITSGQSMVVDEKKKAFQVKTADIERITAWRDGKLDFDTTPLEEVITQINRYLDKKLVIGDDSLKDIHISLILRISDSKHFLASLKELFPIDSKPSFRNEIILTKRQK